MYIDGRSGRMFVHFTSRKYKLLNTISEISNKFYVLYDKIARECIKMRLKNNFVCISQERAYNKQKLNFLRIDLVSIVSYNFIFLFFCHHIGSTKLL